MERATRPFSPIDYTTRFPALDGLRALAVTMVFALHFGGGVHGGWLLHVVNAVRLRGWMGVDLFFVLSGFLITGVLYDTQTDSRYFRRFFARRALRIFPVFYLVFVTILLLTPLLQYQWRRGHLWFLVYLGNFATGFDPTLRQIVSANHRALALHIEHFWSLCVEEQFYLLWPVVVLKVRDRIRLIWIAAGLSLMALVLRGMFVHRILGFPGSRFDATTMTHMLPFRMDALLAGAMLALLLRGPSADLWQRRCGWLFLPAAIVVLGICILSPSADSPWLLTLGFSAIAIAAAGLIGMALRTGSSVFRVFSMRPLRTLGKVSYGFYIYHALWTTAWFRLAALLATRLHSQILGNAIAISAAFVTTLVVSLLSYNLFELRFLQLKRAFEYDSPLTEGLHAPHDSRGAVE